MRLTITTVSSPSIPADIIKNFDAKNWRPIIRATQLAFGVPKSRHQVSVSGRAQPVQIARMKYSFTTVSLPANHDGNETKKGGEERKRERGRKVSIEGQRLPAYLFVYRGNRGWFGVDKRGGSDGKRERRGRAKREEKGENGKRGIG